ncbi:MAG: hypothetical protein C0424_12290 [Sphingobacteriaceae bacterium]|nr:hypothetical protein [Sphingobacteriaceae bacterium]
MNRIFTLILSFFSMALSLNAQTFVQVGTGTDTSTSAGGSAFAPVYRPSATSNTRMNRSNTLYEASELSAIPVGSVITALAWEKANAGGTIPGNPLRLEIWMRHSPLVAPLNINRTWTSITDTFVRVFNQLNAVVPTVPGWISFALDQPFTYLGGALEVATENEIGGTSPFTTAALNWFFTQGTGAFALGGTGSPTFGFPAILNNTNAISKNRSNIRFFYTPPVALDLRADAITSPQIPVPANSVQAVSFNAFNGGSSTITSAQIHYRVNGGAVVTETWSGFLTPLTGTNIVFQTPLSLQAAGQIQLNVWLSNVNGQGNDNNTSNDSLNLSFCLALPAGSYSIGTPTSDFTSIQAAVDFLNCGGITGPVIFYLASGTYTGSYTLGSISGATLPNAITFTSASGTASDVVLIGAQTVAQPDVFNLTGSTGITFSKLRFVRTSVPSTFSYLLHLRAGANNIFINECQFVDQTGNASDQNRGVGMFNTTRVTVQQNSFSGFSRSVIAQADGFVLHNQWLNNTFTNYLADAFFILNQQHALVKGNTFTNFIGTGTSAAACSLRAQRNITVEGNRVLGAIPRYAFMFWDFDNDPVAGPNRIYNNEVAGFTTATITSATAIRQCYVITGFQNANVSPPNVRDQFEFVNNTAYLGVNSGSSNALQAVLSVSGGSDNLPAIDTLVILNNNLVTYALQPGSMPSQFRIMNFNVQAPINTSWSNHNNFFFEGGLTNPLIRLNFPATDYNSVAAWAGAQGGRDSSSVSINPVFLGTAAALPTSAALNNLGTPVAYVQQDINAASRSALTPDIGAYEFDAANVELAITALLHPVSACGLADTTAVRFSVANLGVDSLKGFELVLRLQGQLRQSKHFTDTLLPGSSRVLAFDSLLNLSAGGTYQITIFPAVQLDPNPANDSLRATVVNQLINQFPYLENLDALPPGIPSFANGWTSSSASYRWFVNSGQTGTSATGPSADATTGSSLGRYLYTEASNGSFGNEATITSTCLNLSSLSHPMLEFFYHGHGIDCYQLIIQQEVNGQWLAVDTLEGPTHTHSTQAWLRHRVALNAQSTRFRFLAIRGPSFEGDWAIDDIRIAQWPATDARVLSVVAQADGCDSSATPVVLRISNEGRTALAQVPVRLVRNGAAPIALLLNRPLPAGATDTLQLSLPFIQTGLQALTAYTSVTADTDTRLDTARGSYFTSLKISSFPYIDNFDAPGWWHAGGINPSWQRAAPAANVINAPFNGNASWVTNATGLVNSEERSWLESPCFDFSQLAQPELSFAIWYNTLNTAGGNLQYSTNGGSSWQVLGQVTSGQPWYTADSLPVSGGQAVWTGVISPSGWRQARHSLAFLAGQSSVKFRFQFFSPSTNLLSEGLAIDSFRIADPAGSLPYHVQITPESCSSASHTVTASFTNVSALQQATVRFSVNGGFFNSIPMTQQGNQYTATIPAHPAGQPVTWYIRSTGSVVFESATASYMDGFVTPDLGLQRGVANSTLSIDSRLAVADTSIAGLAASQLANGIFLRMDASRHLEIHSLQIGLDKRTRLRVYQAHIPSVGGTISRENMVKIGEMADVRPDSQGFAHIPLFQSIRLQAGAAVILYFDADTPAAIRVEHVSGFQNLVDSNLTLRTWWVSNTPFTPSAQLAWPAIRMLPQSPVDSLQWYLASAPTMPIANTPVLQLNVGSQPNIYGVRFFRNQCVLTDTFVVSPGIRDLGITRILSPSQWNQVQTDPVDVQAVLRNHGSVVSNQVTVRVLANGQLIQTINSNQTLAPGDTLLLHFPGLNLQAAAPGIRLCVTTDAGDANLANDSACILLLAPTSVVGEGLSGMRLFPNPTRQHSLLQWDDAGPQPVRISLLDALGRVVRNWELPAGSTQHALSAADWPAGLYLIRVESADRFAERRWMVQH